MDGVDEVLEADRFADGLPGADLVVLALALTPDTEGMFSRDEFALMEDHAWIVNVARGKHIITEDLVEALQAGAIGGAGLDVTDPEPLPAGHPLWSMPRVLITPHTAARSDRTMARLWLLVQENLRRYVTGEPLLSVVDAKKGY